MYPKKNLYFAQWSSKSPNLPYVYLPYSVGCLWAYAQTDNDVIKNYDLKELLFIPEEPKSIVDKLENPSVFGISCYVWNWFYNLEIIKLVKEKFPKCLIVAGGPHIPNNDFDFFKKHKDIDICIHQEGELAFTDILKYNIGLCEIEDISGISYPDSERNLLRTSNSNRIPDLDVLPSPYLSGLFDNIIEKYKNDPNIIINGVLETNRGCPYKCTFCDWGDLSYNKLKKINIERVKKEIDWFSDKKFDLVQGVDANFGILYDRDMEIAKYLVKKRTETGFPNFFDTSWAKNNAEKTLDIAKVLSDGNMLKSFMISIQTTNDSTLDAIERKSMEISNFAKLNETAKDLEVEIATEVILGLPNETYSSWKTGLIDLILNDVNVAINQLYLIPNSEMYVPEYRKKYGIKTTHIPAWNNIGIDEIMESVIETNSMSESQLKRAWIFTWFFIGLEVHGFTKYITKYLNKKYSISHSDFYDLLIDEIKEKSSILNTHYENTVDITDRYEFYRLSAIGEYKDFVYNIGYENRDKFYNEIKEIIKKLIPTMLKDELDDIINFQNSILQSYDVVETKLTLGRNLKEYLDEDKEYEESKTTYIFKKIKDRKSILPKDWVNYIIATRLIAGWKNKCIKN